MCTTVTRNTERLVSPLHKSHDFLTYQRRVCFFEKDRWYSFSNCFSQKSTLYAPTQCHSDSLPTDVYKLHSCQFGQAFFVQHLCIFISNSNIKDSNLLMYINHITNGCLYEKYAKKHLLFLQVKESPHNYLYTKHSDYYKTHGMEDKVPYPFQTWTIMALHNFCFTSIS